MKFKEFWNIPSSSDEPLLEISLEKQVSKTPRKYEQLSIESANLDNQRRMVAVLTQILNELDPKKDMEAIVDLEYIIRNYQEWADLNQEILSNLKIVNKSELVEEQLEEGDEWKKGTDFQKREYREQYDLEPKNELFKDSNESMQSRISKIHEELEVALHDFEETYPQVFDRIFELAEQSQENRTN